MSEELQKLQNENVNLQSQLDLANSRIASAHQTLVESMNNALELRSSNILLANKSQKMQQDSMAALSGKQKHIDEMQKIITETKAENARLMALVPAPVVEPAQPAQPEGEALQGN